MIDTDRLRYRIGPLDIWRIGASFLFVGFGLYFVVTFLFSLLRTEHRPWTQLLLGGLILMYGAYRLWAGFRNIGRLRAAREADRLSVEPPDRTDTP
jgi:hypothetical protein